MNRSSPKSLVSYIAPAAPATRRPAEGDEPFLRPEIGFTPRWFNEALGVDFGADWHRDVTRRRSALLAMRSELKRRFPGSGIGGIDRPDRPLDLLTGVFGATVVAAIYGLPQVFLPDQWPNVAPSPLSVEAIDRLEPPDLGRNPFFQSLLRQMDQIAEIEGSVVGFLNWQGILNNAHRLRGQELFLDLEEAPDRCHRLFDCICATMIDGLRQVRARQRAGGVDYRFTTVSNCLVNLISPRHYRDLLLPYDRRLAAAGNALGIHNCAWNATPYLESYATLPNVGYLDLGLDSDLDRAREMFPQARRAVMLKPTDWLKKTPAQMRGDLEYVAAHLGPCDVVLADLEAGTPDACVLEAVRACQSISQACS